MKRKKILTGILIVLLLLCVTIYYYLFAPQFYPQKTTYIHIDRDDTADSIYHKVKTQGHANNLAGLHFVARCCNFSQNRRTGRYAIHPRDNVYQVFKRLYLRRQEPMNLIVASVRTLDGLAHNIGKQLMIDSAEIVNYMNDVAFQRKSGYSRETMPCLFIPETYQVYWDMSVETFFERMQKEHRRFWNEKRLGKAAAMGMTPTEVCTLASIVEEETNDNQEKPLIAGLYINRLHIGMPLQADPTVKFALKDFGLRRINNDQLNIDSPYNTYRNTGLPPGPIRIPSPAGVDAVLNYVKHDYIYMCAKDDFSGTHNFASNYVDHIKNAKRYRDALNERKIFQ